MGFPSAARLVHPDTLPSVTNHSERAQQEMTCFQNFTPSFHFKLLYAIHLDGLAYLLYVAPVPSFRKSWNFTREGLSLFQEDSSFK